MLGCNEYLGWYEGLPDKIDRVSWRVAHDKPLIITEFGADALHGLSGDPLTRWSEEYQASVYEHQLCMLERIPGLRGVTPWILADFRSPRRPLVPLEASLSELTGPAFGSDAVEAGDSDLTRIPGATGEAIGQRIHVTGRVLEDEGRPVANALVEVWQANAAGRYAHPADPAVAPLDPNFQGSASIASDAKGDWRIVTIKPGGYDSPIGHRPPHIHFDIR